MHLFCSRQLLLGDNQLQEVPDSIAACKALKKLHLENNKLASLGAVADMDGCVDGNGQRVDRLT